MTKPLASPHLTAPIDPAQVRYIKLGKGGAFAPLCIERGELCLDYRDVPHELCAAGDWDAVVAHFVERGRTLAKARDATREIRDFYTLGPDCLWITFADGHLWWTHAEDGVSWLGTEDPSQGTRSRRTIGGWRKTSLGGHPLRMPSLSSSLTKVASYQQTICRVQAADYLVRRINDTQQPIVAEADAARRGLMAVTAKLIAGLHWEDFEVMTDLIFTRGGWQRVSVLGKTMANVDLVIDQPTLNERAIVQVKSSAGPAALNVFVEHFRASGTDRAFFVCHTPTGVLQVGEDEPNVRVWTGERLAELALRSGLYDWLVERAG